MSKAGILGRVMGVYHVVMLANTLKPLLDERLFTPYHDLNAFTLVPLALLDPPYAVMTPLTVGMNDIPVEEVPGVYIKELVAEWNTEKREYVTNIFSVSNKGNPSIPINGALLRRIPVDKYKNQVVRSWLLRYKGDDECEPFQIDSIIEGLKLTSKDGPTDTNLKYVAIIYALSQYIGNAPRRAVADAFGISDRTATNWINAARECGYPIIRGDER